MKSYDALRPPSDRASADMELEAEEEEEEEAAASLAAAEAPRDWSGNASKTIAIELILITQQQFGSVEFVSFFSALRMRRGSRSVGTCRRRQR